MKYLTLLIVFCLLSLAVIQCSEEEQPATTTTKSKGHPHGKAKGKEPVADEGSNSESKQKKETTTTTKVTKVEKSQESGNDEQALRLKTAGVGAIVGGIAGYAINTKAKLSVSQSLQPYQATAIGAAIGGASGYMGHSVPAVRNAASTVWKYIQHIGEHNNEKKTTECIEFFEKSGKSCTVLAGSNGIVNLYTHGIHHSMGLATYALQEEKNGYKLLLDDKFVHMMRSHAKANAGWLCSKDKANTCSHVGTSITTVETDADCPYKVATDKTYLKGAAFGRWVEFVSAFSAAPEDIFYGGSKYIGAALAVCAAIEHAGKGHTNSLHGEKGPMEHEAFGKKYATSIEKLKKELSKAEGNWKFASSSKSTLQILMEPAFECSRSSAHVA